MRKSIIFAVLAAIAATMTGCNHGSNSPTIAPDRSVDGHYIVTPTVVIGDCERPTDFVFVVWNGVVSDDGIHGYGLDGEVIAREDRARVALGQAVDTQITAIGLDRYENVFTFEATIDRDGRVTGEFANEECEGWLEGERIL